MRITELRPGTEHELVIQAEDERAGYRAIIAIHNTRLGPACGGTRLWHYDSDADALADALRLSRAMSYKAAAAGLPMGGGKSVILADHGRGSREELFQAHGRFVEHLSGRYITAEDVGTSYEDMAIVRRETQHVAGLRDPSPFTARGVFRALQAAANRRWGTDDLRDRTTLRCEIVVGAANNQLAEPADADRLAARGILNGPDFIANAGGVIDGARYLFGWTEERNRTTIDAIYDTMLEIFASADAQGITPAAVADRLAEARLGAAV